MNDLFRRFADAASEQSGKPWAFVLACGFVVIWIACGPAFGYSDKWQAVADDVTSILPFLLLLLVQATQNRDTKAINLKLDELIRSSQANNTFLSIEDSEDEKITDLRREIKATSKF